MTDYPPGTSLLQAPLVWIGGWRFAGALSVIALAVTTLVTSRWLRECGKSPAFALLVPAFFAAVFFGRIAMSDLPATAVATACIYVLFRSDGRDWRRSLLAGWLGGITLVFREPVAVLLAPIGVGAVLRRRCDPWALLAGVVGAVAVRAALSAWLFGDAWHVRDSGYGFSATSLAHSLLVYGVILLVMFPGGALLPLFYRGERRAELVTAVSAYVALFLFYEYDSLRENGFGKGLVLASRFMVPLTPLLALMAADVWPRWYAMLSARSQSVARAAAPLAGAAVVVLALGAHLVARRQEGASLGIVRGIFDHTSADRPVITNSRATLKYLSPAYGPRRLIQRYGLDADATVALARRSNGASVVLLDRDDSEMFRAESSENERWLAAVRTRCTASPRHDAVVGTARLRIFDLTGC